MPSYRTAALLAVTALAAAPSLAACGSSSDSAGAGAGAASTSGPRVTVNAGDSSCVLDRTDLDAGSTTFAVTNTGSKTTEVYVYAADGAAFTTVVSEVENIGPGLSRDMKVDLTGGTYEVACKPGQTGEGIRTRIAVAGSNSAGGSSGPAESEAAYDREIELTTDGTTITGLPKTPAKAGEKIEFKLTNKAKTPRTLELKDPTGAVAGEAEGIKPGATRELIIDLAKPGTWKIVIEGDGVQDVTADLAVS